MDTERYRKSADSSDHFTDPEVRLWVHALCDEIDRLQSGAPSGEPAGMALVPVEPTPEMLYPDLQTAGPGTQLGDMCAGFGREIWARMLAASQESATTRGGVSRNAELTGPRRPEQEQAT